MDEALSRIQALFSSSDEYVDTIIESRVYPIKINTRDGEIQTMVLILKTQQPAWLLQSDVPFLLETKNEISYQAVAEEPHTVWGEITSDDGKPIYLMPLTSELEALPPIVAELIDMFESGITFNTEPTTPKSPATPTSPIKPHLGLTELLSPQSPNTFAEQGNTVGELIPMKTTLIPKRGLGKFVRQSVKVPQKRFMARKAAAMEKVKELVGSDVSPIKTLFITYVSTVDIEYITPPMISYINELDSISDENIAVLLLPIFKEKLERIKAVIQRARMYESRDKQTMLAGLLERIDAMDTPRPVEEQVVEMDKLIKDIETKSKSGGKTRRKRKRRKSVRLR
jgi:hypothetical protein